MIKAPGINYKNIILSLCFVFASINLLIVVVNHFCFRTFAYDYAVYNFAFFDFAHFRVSPVPLYYTPNVSFLQDHYSLTLAVLSPLYWLLAWVLGSYTLLAIQWLFIVWGAWATYKLICCKKKEPSLGALAALCYLVIFGRFSSCDGDCNLAIIGSAFVPVFLYYFEVKRLGATILCFLFLVFNREDFPLWLFFLCTYLMIVNRKDALKFRWALAFLLASVLIGVLIFMFLIPSMENENWKFTFFQFDVLGKTPSEAILYLFQHPLKGFELLFVNHSPDARYEHVKEEFYLTYLLSGAVVLLYRPATLIPFIPLIAKKMYTNAPFRWSIISYYAVEVASILPVFMFLVIADLPKSSLRVSMGTIICLASMLVSFDKIHSYWRIADLGDSSKYNFFQASFYSSQYNIREINEAMSLIPKDAAVSASCRLAPHLAARQKIYFYPQVNDARYLCLFKHGETYPLDTQRYSQALRDLKNNADWKILIEKPDFVFFVRSEN